MTCGLGNRTGDSTTIENSNTCGTPQDQLGVLLGALAAEIAPAAPDLADLLTAWPTLPEALKAGIVAMVKAACPSGASAQAARKEQEP